ncbi:MAG: ubiquitin-like domain-containing protein [Phototrophicales bacterium]|nr:ubiquitin-like domain-containing protein [Phototrophicales bacterium]
MTHSPQKLPPQKRPNSLYFIFALLIFAGIGITGVGVLLLSIPTEAPKPQPTSTPMTINLELDGRTYPVSTFSQTVGAFLAEQTLTLGADDVVYPPADTVITAQMLIRIERARLVQIYVDNQITTITTTFTSPFNILNLVDIEIAPIDSVQINGTPVPYADIIRWATPVDDIRIRRAMTITIREDEGVTTRQTTAHTVAEALDEAGYVLFLPDQVSPAPTDPIVANMEIVIDRSRELTIRADGRSIATRVRAQTIGDALIESGITLNGLDYSIPSTTQPITEGITIRVIRVTEDIVMVQTPIAYESVLQADANLELDTRAVIQAGNSGAWQQNYRVRYENGVEINRELVEEFMAQAPANEVIAYGTRITIRTVETPDGVLEYWRKFRMYATSYYPAGLGGDNSTSIGETLRKGIVAINPRIIPYRLNVYVFGYGVGRTADTGGPRTTPYWIDLGYSDEDFVGWSRWVDVYVLTPVPETVNYLLPLNESGGPIFP